MKKNSIVFVSTIHRMSERVICVMNELQKDFDVKIVNTGQSSFNTDYKANTRYKKYVMENFPEESIFNTPAIRAKSEARFSHQHRKNVIDMLNKLVTSNTMALILDDSRSTIFSNDVYQMAKNRGSLVFGNAHGNIPTENIPVHYGFSGRKNYDYIFVLGDCEINHIENFGFDKDRAISAGIPDNDELTKFVRTNEIILIVNNFVLSNQLGPYKWDHCKNPKVLDAETLKKMKLLQLQEKLKKKVVFKLKPRMGDRLQEEVDNIKKNVPEGLDYEIIHYVDCEKISNSTGGMCFNVWVYDVV